MARRLSEQDISSAIDKYLITQADVYSNWEPISIFQTKNPEISRLNKTIIEIGSGNGDFLIHLSENNPLAFHIGIEMKRKRIVKCISKSYKRHLNNIAFFMAEAKNILSDKKIQDECVDEYYLTFPDPWPKRKHRRHRLITNEFVETIYRSLKPSGKFTIATDHYKYLEEMIESFDYLGKFTYVFENRINTNLDNFYQSYFEKLWREKGKTIYYCILQKINS